MGPEQQAGLHRAPQLVLGVWGLLPRPHRGHGRDQHERGSEKPVQGHLHRDADCRGHRVSQRRVRDRVENNDNKTKKPFYTLLKHISFGVHHF